MSVPLWIAAFAVADGLSVIASWLLAGAILTIGEPPFNLVGAGAFALLGTHFFVMLRGLRRCSNTGYGDHLFTWTLAGILIVKQDAALGLPFLGAWLYAMQHASVRERFCFPRHPGQWTEWPVGVLLYLLVIFGLVMRAWAVSGPAGLEGAFALALAGRSSGLMTGLLWYGGWPCLAALIFTGVGVIRGWRWALFAAPIGVLYVYLAFIPTSVWAGVLFLAVWFAAGNRRHFGLLPSPAAALLAALILGASFLGLACAWIPVGVCPTHGVATHLYRLNDSPRVKAKLGRRTAYSEEMIVASTRRVRVCCPICEAAVVWRVERSACFGRRAGVVADLQRLASESLDLSAGEWWLSVTGSRLESSPPTLPATWVTALGATVLASGPWQCPFGARLRDVGLLATGSIDAVEFRHASCTSDIETHCRMCEQYGL